MLKMSSLLVFLTTCVAGPKDLIGVDEDMGVVGMESLCSLEVNCQLR